MNIYPVTPYAYNTKTSFKGIEDHWPVDHQFVPIQGSSAMMLEITPLPKPVDLNDSWVQEQLKTIIEVPPAEDETAKEPMDYVDVIIKKSGSMKKKEMQAGAIIAHYSQAGLDEIGIKMLEAVLNTKFLSANTKQKARQLLKQAK